MKAWQERLCEDKDSLQKRIICLIEFLEDTKEYLELPTLEQVDLRVQLAQMEALRDTMSRRIARFE